MIVLLLLACSCQGKRVRTLHKDTAISELFSQGEDWQPSNITPSKPLAALLAVADPASFHVVGPVRTLVRAPSSPLLPSSLGKRRRINGPIMADAGGEIDDTSDVKGLDDGSRVSGNDGEDGNVAGSGPPGKNGRGGDDEAEHEEEPEWVPDDVKEALAAGRIGADEMANWAKVVANPFAKLLALVPYIRARLLAAPTLPTILAIEIAVGFIAVLIAETAARGNRFFKELDFVFANQVLCFFTNIALVLVLSPVAAVAAPPAAGSMAANMAALPGFFLQPGEFSAAQRVACYFSKAATFAAVGTMTSSVGQAITLALVNLRTRLDPGNTPNVRLAPVAPTAAAYAAFMGFSSNTRYQLINGIEAIALPAIPGGAAVQTGISTVLRTLNNCVGAANWVWWARLRGLQ